MADFNLGIVTAIAVALHEIPQELSDFGVLIHGGFSRARALIYNYLSATSVMLGAALTYLMGAVLEPFLPVGLSLVAGGFIYLAATDLLPELHESIRLSHGLVQIIFILIGAALVIAPEFFLG